MDLEAIKARAAAATEGPWTAEYSGETGNVVLPPDAQSTREYVARTQLYLAVFDARFIAHARQDIPDLLAEVERLRAVAPQFDGICLTGSDVGVPAAGIAYAHPLCPLHGDPVGELRAEVEKLRAIIGRVAGLDVAALRYAIADPGAVVGHRDWGNPAEMYDAGETVPNWSARAVRALIDAALGGAV